MIFKEIDVLKVGKSGNQLWAASIMLFVFMLTGINNGKGYQSAMVISFVVLSLISFFSYLMIAKSNNFLWTVFAIAFMPLTFGFVMSALSIWMIAFGPHWSWISIMLGTFWGMWLIPLFLPKLAKQIESELMQPKTKVGKIIIGILISLGGFGGAASGRLASRASDHGFAGGLIFGGLAMISFAYIFQYLAVLTQWEYRKKSQEGTQ